MTAADRVQAEWDLKLTDAWLWTQAEVLERLPQWMRADFDCPNLGAHSWISTQGRVVHSFCRGCRAIRRTLDPWLNTDRDALDVIYDLQFRRR